MLIHFFSFAQDKKKGNPALNKHYESQLELGDDLVKKGKMAEAIKSYNIARILADADDDKQEILDKKLDNAFQSVQALGLDVKALYWSSEASRLSPIQSIRLLEVADTTAKSVETKDAIKEQEQLFFNTSAKHAFREKKRFEDCSDIGFSPKAKWLVVTNSRYKKQLWNATQSPMSLYLDDTDVVKVFFADDDSYVVTVNQQKQAKLRHLDTLASAVEIPVSLAGNVEKVYFSADNQFLAVVESNKATLYHLRDRQLTMPFSIAPHGVQKIVFSKDSQWILTIPVSAQDTVHLWNPTTQQEFFWLRNEKEIRSVQFSSDNRWLVTMNEDGEHKLWDLQTQKQVQPNPKIQRYKEIILSDDDKKVVFIDYQYQAKLYQLPLLKEIPCEPFTKSVEFVKFFPIQSDTIFVKYADGSRKVVSITNDTIFVKYTNGRRKVMSITKAHPVEYLKDENLLEDVFVSSDATWVLTFNDNLYAYKLWNNKYGNLEHFNFEKNIQKIQFSPDAKWIVTKHSNNHGKIWQIDSKLAETLSDVKEFSYSADGKWLMVNDFRGNLRISKMEESLFKYEKIEKNVKKASFSSNGQWGLITYTSGDVKLIGLSDSLQVINIKPFLKKIQDISLGIGKQDLNFDLKNGKKTTLQSFQTQNIKASISKNLKHITALLKPYTTPVSFDNDTVLVTKQPIDSLPMVVEVRYKNQTHRLWLNENINVSDSNNTQIVNKHYLLVKVGRSLVKTDIRKTGDWFSYGDGEEMNYNQYAIEQWKKIFKDTFLLPLEEDIIKKYQFSVSNVPKVNK